MRKYIYIALALLYFLFPFDFLPDVFGLLGRVDDFLVAAFLFWNYKKVIQEKVRRLQSEFSSEKERAENSQASSPVQSPHDILGVTVGAPQKDIARAYKALVKKYHPDMVSHLGDEFQELAHQKMLKIQRAYEELT